MARKKTYASLKKLADKVFSVWVRRKWSDREGLASCWICGYTASWNVLQAGHFISRVHLSTRWDEGNVWPCCYACNVLRRGNMGEFALKLGIDRITRLVELKHQPRKYTRADLEALIETYKKKIDKFPLS